MGVSPPPLQATPQAWPSTPREAKQLEVWQDRALCLTADPLLFMVPDKDSHGEEASSLRSKTIPAALKWCERCPVRRPCGETASRWDKTVTIRGGIDPRHIPNSQRPQGATGAQPRGRPRKDAVRPVEPRRPPMPARANAGQFKPRRDPATVPPGAVLDLVVKGWTAPDIQARLDAGQRFIEARRSDELRALTKSRPSDAFISRKWRGPDKPAWVLGTSVCGRVILVVTNTRGRIQTRFLLAGNVSTRINGAVLERFPESLVRE